MMKKIALFALCFLFALTVFAGCGSQGERGLQGEQGIQGEQGLQGETGEKGENAERYKTYNLYATCGSLPTLYAGLHAFVDNTTESYMIYERRGTFNNEMLLQHTSIKQIFDFPYQGNGVNEANEFRAKVKELYEADNDARFNLFCDDLRAQLEITLFLAQDIPEENFTITLLTDGTGTYSSFTNGAFPYKTATAYSTFLTNKALYDADYIEAATTGDSRLVSGDSFNVFNHLPHNVNALYSSQKKNVRYWMQYPELLENLIIDERMRVEFGYSNIEKVTPTDLLNSLSPIKKAQFALAGKMDPEVYGELFNKDNEKKHLVITGTSPAGEADNFENVLDRIIELYGDDYNLYFKAHPSWGPENVPAETTDANWLKLVGRKELLEEKGVTLLPSMTPMEIMMWFYPDLYVGGYNSSLYMNVARYRTQFFIIGSIASLSEPLPSLYALDFFITESGENPQVIPINYTPD